MKLEDLPNELLTNICSFLDNAQSIAHLDATSRKLHAYARGDGWKTFLRSRFQSIPIPTGLRDYSHAAHGLSTLARNWDRKAILARYIEPSGVIKDLETGSRVREWQRPHGQTMGFHPRIDSYEEFNGGDWISRREVLAWSAGTELLLRLKESGGHDGKGQKTTWFTWKEPGSREGRDDITALKVLRPNQKDRVSTRDTEDVLVGTAGGNLSLLHISARRDKKSPQDMDTLDLSTLGLGQSRDTSIERDLYTTNGARIRSADISPSETPLLAAALSDSKLALYPLHSSSNTASIDPINSLSTVTPDNSDGSTWSTTFLSHNKLAIGTGPSKEPLIVYEVTSSGLNEAPIRKFAITNEMDEVASRMMTVYPIVSLPPSSQAGREDGQVFLSGAYDGIIRVHDLRSPLNHVDTYTDPAEYSAIYSLQTMGNERLVAGGSRHGILKLFDLRMSGRSDYYSLTTGLIGDVSEHGVTDCNLFLHPNNTPRQRNNHGRRAHDRRSKDSPIYALSSPSPYSPSLFTGIEDNVLQLDFVSMTDQHPDPVYKHALRRYSNSGALDIKQTWNPRGDVLNLAMYSHDVNGGMQLNVQGGVGRYAGNLKGYDERWRSSNDTQPRHF